MCVREGERWRGKGRGWEAQREGERERVNA